MLGIDLVAASTPDYHHQPCHRPPIFYTQAPHHLSCYTQASLLQVATSVHAHDNDDANATGLAKLAMSGW